jgi:hypothetical protein
MQKQQGSNTKLRLTCRLRFWIPHSSFGIETVLGRERNRLSRTVWPRQKQGSEMDQTRFSKRGKESCICTLEISSVRQSCCRMLRHNCRIYR